MLFEFSSCGLAAGFYARINVPTKVFAKHHRIRREGVGFSELLVSFDRRLRGGFCMSCVLLVADRSAITGW